jgi:hypothetical protein
VLADATLGINLHPGAVDKALQTVRNAGAAQLTLADFPEPDALSGVVNPVDVEADLPLGKFDVKKKARMRAKGAYRQAAPERG